MHLRKFVIISASKEGIYHGIFFTVTATEAQIKREILRYIRRADILGRAVIPHNKAQNSRTVRNITKYIRVHGELQLCPENYFADTYNRYRYLFEHSKEMPIFVGY